MKWLKGLVVLIAFGGIALVAVLKAPSVYGQRSDVPDRRARELEFLSGRGSALGVTVRDVRPAEAGGDRTAGVLIDEVRPGSPADKAGLARGDIVTEFDGERVRSARQFSRLVQETAPGRAVKAVTLRNGARRNVEITPGDRDRRAELSIHGDFGDYMRDFGRDLGRLGDRLPPFNFNFDFDVPVAGRRLGVAVEELTSQLAGYFGANDGVLVTSVAEGSAAARAGLKAGDVITSIDGQSVHSRQDLLRGLRDAPDNDEVTIGIVRDKRESTVKVILEPPRRTSRGWPV
jgi:S1-C subfamily serine protease